MIECRLDEVQNGDVFVMAGRPEEVWHCFKPDYCGVSEEETEVEFLCLGYDYSSERDRVGSPYTRIKVIYNTTTGH